MLRLFSARCSPYLRLRFSVRRMGGASVRGMGKVLRLLGLSRLLWLGRFLGIGLLGRLGLLGRICLFRLWLLRRRFLWRGYGLQRKVRRPRLNNRPLRTADD